MAAAMLEAAGFPEEANKVRELGKQIPQEDGTPGGGPMGPRDGAGPGPGGDGPPGGPPPHHGDGPPRGDAPREGCSGDRPRNPEELQHRMERIQQEMRRIGEELERLKKHEKD